MKCDCDEHWIPITNFAGVQVRCGILPQKHLNFELVAFDSEHLRALLRCPFCRRHWIREYPMPELQGSGPVVFIPVLAEDPQGHFEATRTEIQAWRETFEDLGFYRSISPEVGPEKCRNSSCDRLRSKYSIFCQRHHFMNLKGREPPIQ